MMERLTSRKEEKLRVVDFGYEYAPCQHHSPGGDTHHSHHHHRQQRFCSNRISTAKYNLFTFLPKFLFMMFSRAAYFYFLVQMCLSWWEVVSPLGGIGFTMALLFVVIVSGAKEAVEDLKRHSFDGITNRTTAHIVHVTDLANDDEEEEEIGNVEIRYVGKQITCCATKTHIICFCFSFLSFGSLE